MRQNTMDDMGRHMFDWKVEKNPHKPPNDSVFTSRAGIASKTALSNSNTDSLKVQDCWKTVSISNDCALELFCKVFINVCEKLCFTYICVYVLDEKFNMHSIDSHCQTSSEIWKTVNNLRPQGPVERRWLEPSFSPELPTGQKHLVLHL